MYPSMQDDVVKKPIELPSFGWVSLTAAFQRCKTELGFDQDETWQLIKKAWENGRLQLRGMPDNGTLLTVLDPTWVSQIVMWGPSSSSYKDADGNMVEERKGPSDLPTLEFVDIVWLNRTRDIPGRVHNTQVNEDQLNVAIRAVLHLRKKPSHEALKPKGAGTRRCARAGKFFDKRTIGG